MRFDHFEYFSPICPLCKRDQHTDIPLNLNVSKGNSQWIEEGFFHCTSCDGRYPILRGIPILLPNIGQYLEQNYIHTLWNCSLSEHHLQWLSEAGGPNTVVEQTRNYLSTYMWAHYGDLDPAPNASDSSNLSSILSEINICDSLKGNILDIGCAVGRSSFYLAEQYQRPVLGIDLNFAMLLHAQEILLHQRAVYGERVLGSVYRWKDFPVSFEHSHLVDFWVADVCCLPFRNQQIAASTSLNVMDCVQSPMEYLMELHRTSKEFHSFCPYDWSTNVTEFRQWIGGHNSFSTWKGDPNSILEYLLSEHSPIEELRTAKILRKKENIDWNIRLHDRSTMKYSLDYFHVQHQSKRLS